MLPGWLRACSIALAVAATPAVAAPRREPPPATSSRVTATEGSVDRRAAQRALRGSLFASCQVTWMGATVVLVIDVAADGTARARSSRGFGEDGAPGETPYVPCVERRATRALRLAHVGEGALTLVVRFPAFP
jgi:hypothetical protein